MSPAALLLAQVLSREERLARLRQGFHTELASNDLITIVLCCAAGLILLVFLICLLRRARTRRPAPEVDHRRTAADLLGLSRRERADLAQIAGRSGPTQFVAMLLTPANLASAWQRASGRITDPAVRSRLDALCRKLFDQPLPQPPAPTPAPEAPRVDPPPPHVVS